MTDRSQFGGSSTKEVSSIMDGSEPDLIRGIKVVMMLAEYATASEGKLTVVGGGWDEIGPQPSPFAIAMLLEVPWHMSNNERHELKLELIDVDGQGVVPVGGDEPISIQSEFVVGRHVGAPIGSAQIIPIPIMIGPVPLPLGRRLEWRLLVNGETHEDWRLAFRTRPEAQSQAA